MTYATGCIRDVSYGKRRRLRGSRDDVFCIRVIGIIDDDNFARRQRLSQDAVDRLPQKCRAKVGRNDD